MKRILGVFMTVFLAIGISRASSGVKLTCNAIYPETSLITKGVIEFANKVKEYTKGSVVIEVKAGGVLGYKGPELLGIVKDGIIPMSDILMGVVQDSEKVFGIPSLPRLVLTYEDALNLYNSLKPFYEKAAEKWNQKILYVAPWPPTGLFTKEEVKNIADFKNLKVRVYNRELEKLFGLLSAQPILLSWKDVPDAVKEGKVNAVLTTATMGGEIKLWEQQFKYFIPLHLDFPLNMVTINLAIWNGLSQDQRAAIEKAAKEIQAKLWEASKMDNAEGIKGLITRGVIINMGGGVTSESRHGIKLMAESGVLLTGLDKNFQMSLDITAKRVVEDFLSTLEKDIADLLRSYMASTKR
ncbi:MAG: TRAP transporter substrate-binding protein [Syntrophobacterales bacterium]|nr:TRAP transporter substrate-binding protein [Syntrophobacterales bacterium]